MKRLIKEKKAQGMLETVITVVLIILFLGGILNIWLWINTEMVKRQTRYNTSRVIAGTSSDTYTLQWPVYHMQELEEDKVLLDAPQINTANEEE